LNRKTILTSHNAGEHAPVTLRRAELADAEAISELILSFRTSFFTEPDGSGAEPFLASVSAEAERGYIESSRYEFVVAEARGALVGFIAMKDRTHLFHLFVSAAYQRQGIAAELWRLAREATGPHGGEAVFTVNSSLPAVPVYERFGFVQASPPVHRDGVAFVPMRCEPGKNAG
jgi:ribosomal protein S18 acetylase RimI-like enzyme